MLGVRVPGEQRQIVLEHEGGDQDVVGRNRRVPRRSSNERKRIAWSPRPSAFASAAIATSLMLLTFAPGQRPQGAVQYVRDVAQRVSRDHSTRPISLLNPGLTTSASTPPPPMVIATVRNSAACGRFSSPPATSPANTLPNAAPTNHTPII